jgi:hypothetical protein
MSLILQGSTSGSITLQEPAVAGTTVLTLPAVSGTILTTGSSGQSIPKAALPTGSVLQVVQGTLSTTFSTTNTTLTDTGLSASITPTSSSSKILVVVNLNGVHNSTTNYNVYYTLLRNSTNLTNISNGSGWGIRSGQNSGRWGSDSITYLDSPSTTSSTTYKVQIASEGGGTTVYICDVNSFSALSTITIMEIAA